MESLGQPYFQPLIPFRKNDLKDMILRLPISFLKKRTVMTHPKDDYRGKNNE